MKFQNKTPSICYSTASVFFLDFFFLFPSCTPLHFLADTHLTATELQYAAVC